MKTLCLLPADKHDTQAMYNLHTCITYTWAILFTSNLQNKVMHRIAFYRFVCQVRNTRRYAHVFGNHRSHLNSDHAEFSDMTNLIDHHESDSDLCFTVNPDGGYRPVGVGYVMTSLIPIIRKHSDIEPHVQLISSTVHTADLINDNRSHLSPPHI